MDYAKIEREVVDSSMKRFVGFLLALLMIASAGVSSMIYSMPHGHMKKTIAFHESEQKAMEVNEIVIP